MFGRIVALVVGLFAPSAPVAVVTTARDRAILVDALNHPDYEFRKIGTLARKIGTTDTAYLTGLLDAIGTRRAYGNNELVGLIAKVGARPRRWSEIG